MTGLLPRMSRAGRRRRPAPPCAASLSEAWRLTGVGIVLAAAALRGAGAGPHRRALRRHVGATAPTTSAWSPRPSPSACRRSPRSTSPCAASTPSRTPAPRSCCRSAIAATNVVLALVGVRRAAAALADGRRRAGLRASPTSVGLALSHRRCCAAGPAAWTATAWSAHYVRLLVGRRAGRAAGLGWWPGLVGQAARRRARSARLSSLAAGGLVLLLVYVGAGPRPARPRADRPAGSAGHPVSPLDDPALKREPETSDTETMRAVLMRSTGVPDVRRVAGS